MQKSSGAGNDISFCHPLIFSYRYKAAVLHRDDVCLYMCVKNDEQQQQNIYNEKKTCKHTSLEQFSRE